MTKQPTRQGSKTGPNLNRPDDISVTDWIKPSLFKVSNLWRILLVLAIIICLLWLGIWIWLAVSYFAGLLLLFMSAWLVALILSPLVRRLIGWGLPKGGAIAIAYLAVVVLMGLFMALVVPGLVSQTTTLIQNIGSLTTDVQAWLTDTAKGLGITSLNLNDIGQQLQALATNLLKNALDVITGFANFLLQILLVTIISASLLAGQRYSDKEKANYRSASGIRDLVPLHWRKFGHWIRLSLERNFGVFLGGQLVVSVFYGLAVSLTMGLTGLPYVVTTGCICGVMMLIPFFGGPLSLLLPLIVAISSQPATALVVIPVLFIFQTALLNVILPKIVGQSSGLGPVATLFVLLAGAQVGGIWGVLLGVPIAGVAVSTFRYLLTSISLRETNESKEEANLLPNFGSSGLEDAKTSSSDLVK